MGLNKTDISPSGGALVLAVYLFLFINEMYHQYHLNIY